MTMVGWLRNQIRIYLSSVDPARAMASSTPGVTTFTVVGMVALFLGLGETVPTGNGFTNLWLPIVLTLIGGSLTFLAWSKRCAGMVGASATLLDNVFYSAALSSAAMITRGNVSIALALVHGLVLAFFPGRTYPLTAMFAFSMLLPMGILLATFQPPLAIGLITVCATLAMLLSSKLTSNHREFVRRQILLEQALGAADRLANESVQVALTSSLLSLGHLLHELCNYQTAISTNLDYLRSQAQLPTELARALKDAKDAQHKQEELLRNTIDELRGRSSSIPTIFQLVDLLKQVAAAERNLNVELADPDLDFDLDGNSEHLRVVMLNLLRNAEQAGAGRVYVGTRLEPSGQAVQITVSDDGSGIPVDQRERLFDSFAISTKDGGSGLGLYLVRRYVELLGGSVEVGQGPLAGAAFVIRLPGSVPGLASVRRAKIS